MWEWRRIDEVPSGRFLLPFVIPPHLLTILFQNGMLLLSPPFHFHLLNFPPSNKVWGLFISLQTVVYLVLYIRHLFVSPKTSCFCLALVQHSFSSWRHTCVFILSRMSLPKRVWLRGRALQWLLCSTIHTFQNQRSIHELLQVPKPSIQIKNVILTRLRLENPTTAYQLIWHGHETT